MKKYSICIIGVYFGTLPKYFNLWLNSCEKNRDVDFLIIGDNKLDNLPVNVRCIETTLQKVKELAEFKLGMKVSLGRPYKCCDFKVVYGVIFEDYLKEYDFWGHCDFDMIFGNLSKFFSEEILDKYDKVLPLGHLSIYRNMPSVNERYKADGSICGDYKTVFSSEKNFIFDEWHGIYNIYKVNNFPMYDKRVFADISSIYTRFKLALKDKNYRNQVFFWEDGKVLRAYYKNGRILTDEFVYIHFKKRNFDTTLDDEVAKNGFYICDNGFIAKPKKGNPSLIEIKKISPYRLLRETKEIFFVQMKKFVKMIYYKLKNHRGEK